MHFDPNKMTAVITTFSRVDDPSGAPFPIAYALSGFAAGGDAIVPKQQGDSATLKRGPFGWVTSSVAGKSYQIDLKMLAWVPDVEFLNALEKSGSRFQLTITYGTRVIGFFTDAMIQKMPDLAGLGDGTDSGEMTFPIIAPDGVLNAISADA